MWVDTKKAAIQSAPKRWSNQYRNWKDCGDKFDKGPITEKLMALKEPYSGEEIDNIIGNDSWTSVSCDECGKKVNAVSSFDINAGEYVHSICRGCLLSAVAAIDERTE